MHRSGTALPAAVWPGRGRWRRRPPPRTAGTISVSYTHLGKPIKFQGTGEQLDDLDVFHPDRMASRILGMGDVLSLIERAQDAADEKAAEELSLIHI